MSPVNWPLRLFNILALGGVATLFVGGSACTAITNTTAVQCASEAECLARGPAFAGTTCDAATRTCVAVSAETGLCTTNQQCITQAGGAPAICRHSNKKCVTLTSPECPTVMGTNAQLLVDSAVVVGALSPVGTIQVGDEMDAALQLAQTEIGRERGGLPPIDGTSTPRPYVIVACHEFAGRGYDTVLAATKHLVNDIGVPVIIGPVDPANADVVATNVSLPQKVLSILPTGTSTSLAALPSPVSPTPLEWSIFINDRKMATLASQLITNLWNPEVITKYGASRKLKVAALVDGNFLGQTAISLFEAAATFNGESAAANATDGNYLRLSVGDILDPVTNPAPEEAIAKAITTVYGFQPDVIIHAYAPLGIAPIMFPLLQNWPSALPLPHHLDIISTTATFPPLLDLLNVLPALRSKILSIDGVRTPDEITRSTQWVVKFNEANPQFSGGQIQSSPLVEGWYDAAYLAAYSIVANGKKPLTGDNLAATLPLLNPPGTTVTTGTDTLQTGFNLLTNGQGIDVEGVTGNMNLDPTTGFVNYDVEAICPAVTPTGAGYWKPSGFATRGNVGVGDLTACGP